MLLGGPDAAAADAHRSRVADAVTGEQGEAEDRQADRGRGILSGGHALLGFESGWIIANTAPSRRESDHGAVFAGEV